MDRNALIDEVVKRVLEKLTAAEKGETPRDEATTGDTQRTLAKRVITEADIITARMEQVNTIIVNEKAIMTALAAEYAKKHNIGICRR